MMNLLLDSSVLVKWFIDESGSDRAIEIQQGFLSGRISLVFAELSLFEVANALHFSGKFTADEITEATTALQALNMKRMGFSQQALNRAVTLAAQYGVAIYDGYLVALAEQNHFMFLTADRKLMRCLSAHTFVSDLDTYILPQNDKS